MLPLGLFLVLLGLVVAVSVWRDIAVTEAFEKRYDKAVVYWKAEHSKLYEQRRNLQIQINAQRAQNGQLRSKIEAVQKAMGDK